MDPGSSSYQHPYRDTPCNIVMVILVEEVMTDDGDHCGALAEGLLKDPQNEILDLWVYK
jgi:hypothetical protein